MFQVTSIDHEPHKEPQQKNKPLSISSKVQVDEQKESQRSATQPRV